MKYNEFQHKFLKFISDVQDDEVQIALSKYKDGDDIENLLLDVTYNVIVEIMTMIDGYCGDNNKLEIIDTKTGVKLKEDPFIELHDSICDYIKYEKSSGD